MGLLDDFSQFVKTPEGMGLLSAVAGGLAGANRGTPINNLGRAGLAGVMGYGNALDRQERTLENEQQRKLRQMQMDEATRKLAEQKKTEDFFTNVIPGLMSPKPQYAALSNGMGPTVENAARIPDMPQSGTIDAPSMYRAMLESGIPSLATTGLQGLTKQEEPIALGDGGMLVTKSGKKLMENPKADATPSAIKEYQFAQQQGYKGSFQQFQTDLKRAGATNVSYGAPVAGVDANNNPVFFQPSKDGSSPAIVPGVKPQKDSKPPTEFEGKAAFYAQNMAAAENTINTLENQGMDMSRLWSQAETGAAGSVVGNMIASPRAQQARQAQNQWAEQMLRMQTGAAATQPEIDRTIKTYFPQPGDGKDVVDLKRKMRKQAQSGVYSASGRAQDRVDQPTDMQAAARAELARRKGK